MTEGDVIEIEDHQMDNMQSKRKYNSGNSGYDDSTTKSKYYCSVICVTRILYIKF